jgi:hypothetical protein
VISTRSPDSRSRPSGSAERVLATGRFTTDKAGFTVDDLVDPTWWDTDGDGQPVLSDLQRDEELLEKDLPRVDRRTGCHARLPPRVVDPLLRWSKHHR